MESRLDITALLTETAADDGGIALDAMFPLIYEELRRLARRQLRREAVGHTLSTTALVHEAYLRLVDQTRVDWRGRAHFLGVAAKAMRRILIDHARRHRRQKRGGRLERVPLDRIELSVGERAQVLVDLDEALQRLAQVDARQARVVECRFFGGMTEEETAAALGISLRTTKRDWAKARSWLYLEMSPDTV